MRGTVFIALVTALLGVAVPGVAGKVYKWTDEDGNVHFSQTPPPDSNAADVEESGESGAGGRLRLAEARWYLASGDDMYVLEFGIHGQPEVFELQRVRAARNRGRGRLIRGQWALEGARLTLDFDQESRQGASRPRPGEPFAAVQGRRIRFRLEPEGADRMKLDGSRTRFNGNWLAWRERELAGQAEQRLEGGWSHRGSESRIEFHRDGRFEVRGRVRGSDELGRYAYGTWRYYDPILHLQVFEVVRSGWRQSEVSTDSVREHELDMRESLRLHRWRVERLDGRLLELVDPDTGTKEVFIGG